MNLFSLWFLPFSMWNRLRASSILIAWFGAFAAPSPLSLEEAVALAERHNPALRVAAASVEEAEAGITTARAYSNPTITFGSLGRQQAILSAGVPGTLHGFNFTQLVELPQIRSTRLRVAQIDRATSDHSLAAVRLEVRSNVKQRYFEALRTQALLEVAKGNLELLEDLMRRIQVQVDVGEAARLELTRAQAEAASARIQVRAAELRVAGSLSSLAAAIGAPLGQVQLSGTLERPTILPTLEELRQEMIRRHPVLAVAASMRQRAEASLDSERARRIPQPSLWVDWFRQPEAAQYRFGVTVPLPIFNRREGPIAEAAAQQRRAASIGRLNSRQRSNRLTTFIK
jgi:outer membrane protein, heavy metal efflux system